MARRPEPLRKSVKDVLEDLEAGYREAALEGPAVALRYLERAFASRDNFPYAVRTVVFDLTAECQARLGDWAGCLANVRRALEHLDDAAIEFPHGYRAMLGRLSCFERGIQAASELGEFREALALCDRALALGLGAHYGAKRDSLAWADQ